MQGGCWLLISFEKFTQGIHLNEDAIKSIEWLQQKVPLTLKQLFYENKAVFFETVKSQGAGSKPLFLYLYIELARNIYDEYVKKGIEDKVYFDTMSDIAVWADNCKRTFGIWGINEYEWLTRHLEMKLFKLGRLQFELIIFDKTVSVGDLTVTAGQKVLNVHIQQGELLIYEECKASYEQARAFFKNVHCIFVCHSWLLNPALKELLPKSSNIIQFQEDYFVFEIDENDRQCEDRLFGTFLVNPEDYPKETSLQRKAVEYLKNGKKLGIGYGVFQ